MVTRDSSSDVTERRRALVAMTQLMELFGAVGTGHYFAVRDADQWASLLVWAMGARRSIAVSGGMAADAIEMRIGGSSINVQGPIREASIEDYRRMREQNAQEEG